MIPHDRLRAGEPGFEHQLGPLAALVVQQRMHPGRRRFRRPARGRERLDPIALARERISRQSQPANRLVAVQGSPLEAITGDPAFSRLAQVCGRRVRDRRTTGVGATFDAGLLDPSEPDPGGGLSFGRDGIEPGEEFGTIGDDEGRPLLQRLTPDL